MGTTDITYTATTSSSAIIYTTNYNLNSTYTRGVHRTKQIIDKSKINKIGVKGNRGINDLLEAFKIL